MGLKDRAVSRDLGRLPLLSQGLEAVADMRSGLLALGQMQVAAFVTDQELQLCPKALPG